MNLDIKKTHTHTIELTPPLFWKREGNCKFIGFLNDKTAIRLTTIGDDYIAITNTTPEMLAEDIIEAYTNFFPCSESEFMSAYDDAWESIRLRPMQVDTGRDQAIKELQIG